MAKEASKSAGRTWNARRSPVNTDELEAALFRAERRASCPESGIRTAGGPLLSSTRRRERPTSTTTIDNRAGRVRPPSTGAHLRAFVRLCALLGLAAAYVAAHWVITLVGVLHEQGQFDAAPIVASRMAGAIGRLEVAARPGGGPLSAAEAAEVAVLDDGAAWFTRRWSSSTGDSYSLAGLGRASLADWVRYRTTGVVAKPYPSGSAAQDQENVEAWQAAVAKAQAGSVDPEGELTFTRRYFEDLPAAIEQGDAALEQDLYHARDSTIAWGAGAVLVLPLVGSTVISRRRAARSSIIRVARRYTRRRPVWSRPLFATLTAVAFTLIWIGIFGVGIAVRGSDLPFVARLVVGLGAVVCALAGGVALPFVRPRAIKDPVRALVHDGRPPVLYLRSFADDRTAAAVDPTRTADLATGLAEVESREELLAIVLGSIGPVVTVGRPGERIPPIGAARLYLPPGDWQPRVAQLMDLAALVVLRLGDGAGLWWEFAYCVRHLPPEKVIVLVPGAPLPAGLASDLDRHLPQPFDLAAVAGRSGDRWISTVLTFGPSWRPHAVPVGPLPGENGRRSPGHEVARSLQAALASVGLRRRALGLRINRRRLAVIGKVLLVLPALVLGLRVLELFRG